MSEDREPLSVILARIDENVRQLRERADEDRENNAQRLENIEGRTKVLESWKDRAMGIVAVIVIVAGMAKDAFAQMLNR